MMLTLKFEVFFGFHVVLQFLFCFRESFTPYVSVCVSYHRDAVSPYVSVCVTYRRDAVMTVVVILLSCQQQGIVVFI